MTRRLGGPKKSLAAIASVTLAATLAWAGAMTGCGSSGGSQTNTGDGGDGGGQGLPDTGELPDTYVADTYVADTYVAPTVLAAPTFTPPTGGTFTGTGSVTINPPAGFPASGSVYYTTNGTNPNPNSQVVVGPIQVSTSETIAAYASAPGYQDSVIARATYTVMAAISDAGPDVVNPPTVPVFNPTSTKQNNDFKVAVGTTAGATVCYTLDGVTTPTCNASGACTGSSLQYNSVSQIQISGSVTNATTGSVTVQAISCEAGQPSSAVSSSVYVLQVAAPSFTNPGPGTVLLGVTPIVQSATTGATISYTTTATVPTCINGTAGVGTAVSDPHTFQKLGTQNDPLIGSTTYQTIGCKPGYAPSTVSTSAFVVQLNALTFPVAPNQGAPGTYDTTVTQFTFGDSANNAILGQDWGCYATGATAPTCGATMGTCGATFTATTGGLSTAGGNVITATGTTLTVIDCAVGYTPSALAMGTYTLQLDPPDLYLPGTAGENPANVCTPNAPAAGLAPTFPTQVANYPIPGNAANPFRPSVEQSGSGQSYGFVCVIKGGTPACAAGACTTGTPLDVANIGQGVLGHLGQNEDFAQCSDNVEIPPAAGTSVAAGDVWSIIGCPDQGVAFAPSPVVQVTFSGPGQATAPQISPNSGTENNPLSPTITNTDANASTICWTEDGTTPTCNFAGPGCGGPGTTYTAAGVAAAGAANISSFTMVSAGSGYTSAPAVTLTGGGATTQAAAGSTLSITGFTLSGGAGYTISAGGFSCIHVDDASGAGGDGAYVDAILTGGTITSLVFDANCGGESNGAHGDGYGSPTITLPAPTLTGGTQATATVLGQVDAVFTVSNQSDYSTPPVVTISGGGGSGAAFDAVTSNSFQPGVNAAQGSALQYNTLISGTSNVITAIACNATESNSPPSTGTYTFTLLEPDVTSLNGANGQLGAVGDLDSQTTINAGASFVISTGSNFPGQFIAISYGATPVTCSSGTPAPNAGTAGIPAGAANGASGVGPVAASGSATVQITVPTGVTSLVGSPGTELEFAL